MSSHQAGEAEEPDIGAETCAGAWERSVLVASDGVTWYIVSADSLVYMLAQRRQ